MGFGTEVIFLLMLGLVVLGPQRLHAMLGHLARAKAELEKATRGIKSQLGAELDAAHDEGKTETSRELVADQ
jgi:Sec-independent protein translocase protein TatA